MYNEFALRTKQAGDEPSPRGRSRRCLLRPVGLREHLHHHLRDIAWQTMM